MRRLCNVRTRAIPPRCHASTVVQQGLPGLSTNSMIAALPRPGLVVTSPPYRAFTSYITVETARTQRNPRAFLAGKQP